MTTSHTPQFTTERAQYSQSAVFDTLLCFRVHVHNHISALLIAVSRPLDSQAGDHLSPELSPETLCGNRSSSSLYSLVTAQKASFPTALILLLHAAIDRTA
jgi:hypothetical protein